MQTTTQIEPESEVTDNGAQPKSQRKVAAQQLLQQWLSDESGYDEETWPVLKQALEQNRSASDRRLFSD